MLTALLLQVQATLFFAVAVNGFGADFLCSRITGLSPKQREICETAPGLVAAIGEGKKLGLQECRHQFRFHRWNCPILGDNFNQIETGNRETAFLYAISSAGVTFAVTQACALGNISSCGCAPQATLSPKTEKGFSGIHGFQTTKTDVTHLWHWRGCSPDIHYGVKIARRFMDLREWDEDARGLMNLHNNKAGRRLVQTMLRKECKCHGMSGSCTLRTCWKKLPTFRRIAENLTEKYRRAKPVVAVVTSTSINTTAVQANTSTTEQATSGGTRPRRSLVLLKSKDFSPMSISSVVKVRRSMPAVRTTPRRSDLVYLDASPNYCELDQGTGSQGTKSRRCLHSTQVNSSTHENSCDVLCCGRGYNTHQKLHTWKCNCRFRWCCEVECHQCKELLEIYTCK